MLGEVLQRGIVRRGGEVYNSEVDISGGVKVQKI